MRKMLRRGMASFMSLVVALGLLAGIGTATVKAADNGVAINATNFPDAKFRSYVKSNYDNDSNNYLSDSEITKATNGSTVKSCGASDLTGLEYLTGLTSLDCTNMGLDNINVRNNWALKTLKLTGNDFTELDIYYLTNLTAFEADSKISTMTIHDDYSLVPECVKTFMSDNNVSQATVIKLSDLDVRYITFNSQSQAVINDEDSYEFEMGDDYVIFIPYYSQYDNDAQEKYMDLSFKYYFSKEGIVDITTMEEDELDGVEGWNDYNELYLKPIKSGSTTLYMESMDGSRLVASMEIIVAGGEDEEDDGDDDLKDQVISVPKISYTKAYGAKAFNLKATTSGNGALSYVSSKPGVAKVSSTGKVTIVGTGKTVITITAAATGTYNKATKKVTITVKPKKAVLKKLTSPKKKVLKVVWAKDTMAKGYQVVIGTNKKCTKNQQVANIKKMKTTSVKFTKLKSGTTYYVKVRSYVTIGGKKVYGKYSKVMKLKVK